MNAAFQIIAGGPQIAQFLRFHHRLIFGGGLNFGLFCRNCRGVEVCNLGFARRDVKPQFVIELQGLVIKHIKAFDVLQQHMLVLEKVIGDAVNLALHFFETGGEFCHGCSASQKAFPPAALAAHVQFGDRETADRGDDIA